MSGKITQRTRFNQNSLYWHKLYNTCSSCKILQSTNWRCWEPITPMCCRIWEYKMKWVDNGFTLKICFTNTVNNPQNNELTTCGQFSLLTFLLSVSQTRNALNFQSHLYMQQECRCVESTPRLAFPYTFLAITNLYLTFLIEALRAYTCHFF